MRSVPQQRLRAAAVRRLTRLRTTPARCHCATLTGGLRAIGALNYLILWGAICGVRFLNELLCNYFNLSPGDLRQNLVRC